MDSSVKLPINQQQPIITLDNQIFASKNAGPHAETSELEREIDQLVYRLYRLTDEEMAVVERMD